MPAPRVPSQGRPRGEGSSFGEGAPANGGGEPVNDRAAQP